MAARGRILFIIAIFGLLFISALGRLFYLQIVRGSYYKAKALNQQGVDQAIPSERGNIYLTSQLTGASKDNLPDIKNIPIALTRTWYNVWISPKELVGEDRPAIVKSLAGILNLDEKTLAEQAAKENDSFESLVDKTDKDTIDKLAKLNYRGVYWKTFQDRYYPLGEFASQVIGFVNRVNPNAPNEEARRGQYGLEEFFNDELKGASGYIAGFKKALGSLILPLSNITQPEKGNDVYLTLDYNIQLAVEKELKAGVDKFNAAGASAIVMDPKTGAILAMASYPNFDPNKYNEVTDPKIFMNPNTQMVFEPGSIFKTITMATALDINVVSPDLTYYDSGEIKVGAATIRNSTRQSWGQQTMTQVLEKSLNTGVIFVLRRMPQGVWREYINNFGFGEKTSVSLIEAKGDINNLKSGVELDWLVSSFGQGISVTPLAMADAVSAIANGGDLLQPYLVSRIVDADGHIVFNGNKVVKRKVIKASTSQTLTGMLINVVENGSGKQARIPGYSVAGKTGTAQVAMSGGGYYTDKTIHTFVGYSPAYNPAFLMLIKLDDPRGVEFSESSAVPMFKNIGEFILHYLQVPPDKPLKK